MFFGDEAGSPMGVEPPRDEAQRSFDSVPRRATGAPSGGPPVERPRSPASISVVGGCCDRLRRGGWFRSPSGLPSPSHRLPSRSVLDSSLSGHGLSNGARQGPDRRPRPHWTRATLPVHRPPRHRLRHRRPHLPALRRPTPPHSAAHRPSRRAQDPRAPRPPDRASTARTGALARTARLRLNHRPFAPPSTLLARDPRQRVGPAVSEAPAAAPQRALTSQRRALEAI